MKDIGILSTVEFNVKMLNSFNAGMSSINVDPSALNFDIRDQVGFDPDKLKSSIDLFDANIKLIVALGGVGACKALINHNPKAKPFVSLVGTLDNLSLSAQFKGCVNLDEAGQNATRVIWLANHVNGAIGGASGNIGLLYNPNASWGNKEATGFTGASHVAATNALSGPSLSNFFADFRNFPSGTKAVVVSAAAFFFRNREALIGAANTYGAYICYPLQGYKNLDGNNQPTAGNAVVYGPDLDGVGNDGNPLKTAAYYLLGVMAAQVWNPGVGDGKGNPNPALQTASIGAAQIVGG